MSTDKRIYTAYFRCFLVIYPSDIYSPEEILRRAGRDNLEEEDISVLAQEVVL